MEDFKIDALIVTEMWLKDNMEDELWTKSSQLNTNRYQIQTSIELIRGEEE